MYIAENNEPRKRKKERKKEKVFFIFFFFRLPILLFFSPSALSLSLFFSRNLRLNGRPKEIVRVNIFSKFVFGWTECRRNKKTLIKLTQRALLVSLVLRTYLLLAGAPTDCAGKTPMKRTKV